MGYGSQNGNLADYQTRSEKNQPGGYAGITQDGKIPATLIVRAGTQAEIDQIVLAEGELGYCTDTKQLREGDGQTAGGTELGGPNGYAEHEVTEDEFTLPLPRGNVLRVYATGEVDYASTDEIVLADGRYLGQQLYIIVEATAGQTIELEKSCHADDEEYDWLVDDLAVHDQTAVVHIYWNGSEWHELNRWIMGYELPDVAKLSKSTGNNVQQVMATISTTSKRTYQFVLQISAYNVMDNLGAGFWLRGAVRKDDGGTLAMLGAVTEESWAESGMESCDVEVSVAGGWQVLVTGLTNKTIRWRGILYLSEASA